MTSKDWQVYFLDINDIQLQICIESLLYYKYDNVFDNVLKHFRKKCISEISITNVLYVCAANIRMPDLLLHNLCICNTTKETWIFELLTRIEQYAIEMLGLTVFHGSSLELMDRTVLIMGKRKTGKTTLTHYLVQNGWGMLDDDCIYYAGNIIYGIGLPLRLRELVYDDKNVLVKSIDTDGIERSLVITEMLKHQSMGEKIVVFPYYNPHGRFKVTEIKKSILFEKVLTNVRYSISNAKTLVDVTKLIKDVSVAYSISYSNCSDVNVFLKELR